MKLICGIAIGLLLSSESYAKETSLPDTHNNDFINAVSTKEPKQLLPTVNMEPSKKPFLELGIVGGTGWVPDYPAANEGRIRGIVLPYLRL